MPLTEQQLAYLDAYATALAEGLAEIWPPISEAKRERLAVLLSEPPPGADEPHGTEPRPL